MPEVRQPVPPFTRETAIVKVRLAEDGWNSRDAGKVALPIKARQIIKAPDMLITNKGLRDGSALGSLHPLR
ncbi:hypothetical protein C4K23_1961 [Pseudomonas chlororaphis]|nr:hypothetical protein C4K23_1961 [Pseudomonas chlororaphis]ETD37966.1 hypothetical protein U724_17790 [Pseudomonas chlororaphis subsp. aurantiaca PB-St2]